MESIVGLLKHVRNLKVVLFAYSILFLTYLQFTYVQKLFENLPNKFVFEITGLFGCILSSLLAGEFIFQMFKKRSKTKIKLKALKQLSPFEKEILRRYVFGNERTQFFRLSGGEINHLVSIGAIYRASTISQIGDVFSYNIQPWAFEYLTDHPELISGDAEEIEHLSDPLGRY